MKNRFISNKNVFFCAWQVMHVPRQTVRLVITVSFCYLLDNNVWREVLNFHLKSLSFLEPSLNSSKKCRVHLLHVVTYREYKSYIRIPVSNQKLGEVVIQLFVTSLNPRTKCYWDLLELSASKESAVEPFFELGSDFVSSH